MQAVEKSGSAALQRPITRHNLVVFRGGHDALQVCHTDAHGHRRQSILVRSTPTAQVLPPLLDVVPEARLNLAIHQAFSARSTAAALALVHPLVAPVELEEWLVKGAVLAAHADAVMQQPGSDVNPLIQVGTATNEPGAAHRMHQHMRGGNCQGWVDPGGMTLSAVQEWLATASECLRVFGSSDRECDTVQGALLASTRQESCNSPPGVATRFFATPRIGRQAMASHHILQGDWPNAALYLSSIKEFAGDSDEFHWNFGMVQVCW